jgi:hypothetical protein
MGGGVFATDNEVLSNILAKAHTQESYCLSIHGTAVIDPVDSGYNTRMEFTENRQLWVKRAGKATLRYQAGTITSKPVQYPAGLTTISNVVVYNGHEWFDVEYQSRLALGVRCVDPKRTCKLFYDADTIISVLIKDPGVRYAGRKEVDGIICEVFRSHAKFFSPRTSEKPVEVEIAIDQSSGLPAKMSFNTENSSSVLKFIRTNIGVKVDESRFRPPPGIVFREATPDSRGGWTTRLTK